MSLYDIVSILVAAVCLPGIPLYLWACSGHVEKMCKHVVEIVRTEQTPIVIEAHNGMTPAELDELMYRAEVLREQRASAMSIS